jgi:hypothetical protein
MVTKWFLVNYQVLCRMYGFPTQKYEKMAKPKNFLGAPLTENGRTKVTGSALFELDHVPGRYALNTYVFVSGSRFRVAQLR